MLFKTLLCSLLALGLTASIPVAAGSLPDSLWTSHFGVGASFGDPTTFCRPAPRHTQRCAFTFLVFNSSVLRTNASIVALAVEDGETLWTQPLPAVAGTLSNYNGWVTVGQAQGGANDTLFTATTSHAVAFDAATGATLWSKPTVYKAPHGAPSQPTAPAHPTYFAGRVFYTFENGVNSSAVIAVNATDGATLWVSPDIAVTLIWPVALPGLIAYVARDVETGDVYATARMPSGQLAWRHGPLAWSPPGLWDNPNFDVDAEGAVVFMYAKPHIGLRQITAFDASTGGHMWTVNSTDAETIVDYDTYAYAGDFFRLMTVNSTCMVIQRLQGTTGQLLWSTNVATADQNSILLVGAGLAMQFGLSSRSMTALTAQSGSFAWDRGFLQGSPTTGALVTVPLVRFTKRVTGTVLGFGIVPAGDFMGLVAAVAEY